MLPCSMTRSLPSRDASAAAKNSLSTTFWVPCSITRTSSSSALTVVVATDLADQLGAEVRAVHRGDADGDAAGLGPVGGYVGDPGGLLDHDVVVAGDDVEPVPAAVDERHQREVELEVVGALVSVVVAESTRCERPLAIER